MLRNIPVEILLSHHRLTLRQVNALLGEGTVAESTEEKVRALELTGEFLEITDALRENGIEFISLKGPLLSARLHGDPTVRYFGDADILVPLKPVDEAAAVLTGMGYLPPSGSWPDNSRKRRILTIHANELEFSHPVKQLTVELHWRLLKVPLVSAERLEVIIEENSEKVIFSGREFSVMKPELELLYLVIHGGWHWWHRLKWLVDIKDYLEKMTIDTGRFRELMKELKAERMVGLCNAMLMEYLPESRLLPAEGVERRFMTRFCRKRIASHSEPLHDFFGRAFGSVCYSMVSFPGFLYKLRMIRMYLFVPAYFGKNSFFSSLPLFYVYGPVKLLANRLREMR